MLRRGALGSKYWWGVSEGITNREDDPAARALDVVVGAGHLVGAAQDVEESEDGKGGDPVADRHPVAVLGAVSVSVPRPNLRRLPDPDRPPVKVESKPLVSRVLNVDSTARGWG